MKINFKKRYLALIPLFIAAVEKHSILTYFGVTDFNNPLYSLIHCSPFLLLFILVLTDKDINKYIKTVVCFFLGFVLLLILFMNFSKYFVGVER